MACLQTSFQSPVSCHGWLKGVVWRLLLGMRLGLRKMNSYFLFFWIHIFLRGIKLLKKYSNSWSWGDQAGKPSVERFDKGKCKISITKPLSQLTLWYPTPGLLSCHDHKFLYFSAIIEGSLIYNLKHPNQSTLPVPNYLKLKSDSMLNF